LVARKWQLDTDGSMDTDIWIASELMSKEPLAAVTRDYDTEWNDVVEWVWFGMITAEERGVSSSNYATQANDACAVNDAGSATDPGMCRLLTENFGLGTADNPLSDTWMQDVLAASGNYGEAYDDAFCDGTYDGVSGSDAMSGCLISRAGTLNALVSEGGIQYAPSMR
jgi:general L-amino acid transport system substrate-binding protein